MSIQSDAIAQVVEALEMARSLMSDYAPKMWSEHIARIESALAAARDQPTQEKLPLGHAFRRGSPLNACEEILNAPQSPHYCGQPASAHQPTQDNKPEDRR